MKKIYVLSLLMNLASAFVFGQNDPTDRYKEAESLFDTEKYSEVIPICEELEESMNPNDSLYAYVLWFHGVSLWNIETQFRENREWEKSLKYALECEKILEKSGRYLSDKYLSRKYWLYKNIVVAYFGLNQLDEARKYQEKLYEGYKAEKLPKGIDKYYNFQHFVVDGKNVWGYEWYEELPENRFSKSFSKIVYYVYSTNPDGTDNQQLYNLQVLMFHGNDAPFDYVLTRRSTTNTDIVSGSFYDYVYVSPVDYEKLSADIQKVVRENPIPDTKGITKKRK